MLEGRDLVAGVGLAAFILILFPAAISGATLDLLAIPFPITLLGLAGFFAALGTVGLDAGAG